MVDLIAANRRGAWPVRVGAADRERARAALARVGGERLLCAVLRGLSGGEMQRAYLARALVNEPALLLLDEPTAGVDARGRGEFLDLLAGVAAREDLAAVLVTHNAAAVRRLAHRVVYLDARVKAWGTPAEVLDREWDRAAFSGHDHDAPPPPCARTSDGRDPGRPRPPRWPRASCAAPLIAGLTVGAVCALLGVFIVQRGLAFLGDGLAHATFGGLALGLCSERPWTARCGWRCPSPPRSPSASTTCGGARLRGGDVATGVFFSFSFALGILFLGLRTASAAPVNVEGLLFGSLLAATPSMLRSSSSSRWLVIAVHAWIGPRLAYATFDPELAALSGVPVAALEYLLLALTALVVVVGAKTVGVVLVSAFVVIPAATASLLGRTLGAIALLAVGLSLAGTAFGLFASYHLNVATGATIILTLGATFFLALVLRRR